MARRRATLTIGHRTTQMGMAGVMLVSHRHQAKRASPCARGARRMQKTAIAITLGYPVCYGDSHRNQSRSPQFDAHIQEK